MAHRSQREDAGPKRLIDRLEHVASELNAFLLVLAIGLAALNLTCFFAFKVRDALPSVVRVEADPLLVSKPAMPVGSSSAILAPTKPGAAVTGR